MAKRSKKQVRVAPNVEPDTKAQSELSQFLESIENPPKTFERGQIVTGEVVAITKGEMLVDVGGRAEGVVAGSEMKLEGEKLVREPGDEVLVYVIRGENDKGQIELSVKRTGTARKWYELKVAQDRDESVMVKASEANTGGLIVDIGGGLRGFIPTSQLDSSRIQTQSYADKDQATQEMQTKLAELIGEQIEVKIIEIDREKNRVIFSEKLVTSGADLEQRAETLASAKVGNELDAEVTGIAPFGLFVNAEGLEGLVHLSEISWDKVSDPADFYKVGDKVKVQIIGIQDDGKRVAYSIKRTEEDPWDKLVSGYSVGDIVDAEVTKVVDYGAFVRLGEALNGLVHISELSDKLVRDPRDILREGDSVKLKIISVSREDRHLGLSLKQAQQEDPDEKVEIKFDKKSEDSDIAPEMESLQKYLE
ncbi:MAG: 30S ribosomal protein S1 [Candidatus Dojkabacteria bacterium]